jgi:hypothetical protein
MNYEPNFKKWTKGSLVSHDCDAKSVEYLMKVVRVLPMNLVECVYANRKGHSKKTYINHVSVLHDPADFGINIAEGTQAKGISKPHYEVWSAKQILNGDPLIVQELQIERRLAHEYQKTDEFKELHSRIRRRGKVKPQPNSESTSVVTVSEDLLYDLAEMLELIETEADEEYNPQSVLCKKTAKSALKLLRPILDALPE